MLLGLWGAFVLIHGHTSVFIHEVKHSLLSGLVGNKYKGMDVNYDSGEFRYGYYQHTAHFNALIALAPYFFPISWPFFLICGYIFFTEPTHRILIFGIGYGLDLSLQLRDISPIQTDISNITGGFTVGLFFILLVQLMLATFFLTWTLQGWAGFPLLFNQLWNAVISIVWYYTSR